MLPDPSFDRSANTKLYPFGLISADFGIAAERCGAGKKWVENRERRSPPVLPLEVVAQCELHQTRLVRGRGHHAEDGVADGGVGGCKAGVVGYVEEFSAELQILSCVKSGLLDGRKIPVVDAIGAQLVRRAGSVAGGV